MRQSTEDLWAHQRGQWRSPGQVISHWLDGGEVDRSSLRGRAQGAFWEVLEELDVTLLVSREYEHLLIALSIDGGRPRTSYMALPHPCGIALDERRRTVHVASTRNPNQILELQPVTAQVDRADFPVADTSASPLVPVRSRFLPGCAYIHDLALVGGELYVNAVGFNAVGRLDDDGRFVAEWWPKTVERNGGPDMTRNYIQLNSIAAGPDLGRSFFTASSERPGARFPGQLSYPVDGRGVVFSGRTGDVVARGLTRPHSARQRKGRIWIDNSGYGEFGVVDGNGFEAISRLPGWTRGLAMAGEFAFVGTSRVIPRFQRYAPGVGLEDSRCAVHVVELSSGSVVGSLSWPAGNQIFGIEAVPAQFSLGFPARVGDRGVASRIRSLYYCFDR